MYHAPCAAMYYYLHPCHTMYIRVLLCTACVWSVEYACRVCLRWQVRRLVEQKLDVAKGYLDEHKDVVTTFIDEFIKVKNDQEEAAEAAAAGGSDKEQAEDDDDESPRPKKKAKPAAATPEGQAPKGVKSMQCNIMTGREFEKKADRVSIEVPPRPSPRRAELQADGTEARATVSRCAPCVLERSGAVSI